MGERLGKYLARAGAASRRGAEGLVRAGRVAVNGRVVLDPASPVEAGDAVSLDGRALVPEALATYALHKPRGYVTTVRDPQGRPTVMDLVRRQLAGEGPREWRAAVDGNRAGEGARLYPVGRLDAQSEGLLLLTNDGALCQALTHPRHAVGKTYRVLCEPVPQMAQLQRLAGGVRLADGPTLPAEVRDLSGGWIEVVLREGRNRQLRRMCAAVGLNVGRLVRVAVGGVSLEGLRPGALRRLSGAELAALRAAAGVAPPE